LIKNAKLVENNITNWSHSLESYKKFGLFEKKSSTERRVI